MPITRQPGSEPSQRPETGTSASFDETELSRRLVQGDLEAAERLAELTYRKTYAALMRLTGGDSDLAADLTQETYRRAWSSLRSFRGGAKFSTWLYRIAYNAFLNHVRKPQRLSPFDDEQVNAVVDPRPSQEADLAKSRRAARLRRAVLALPEELRFTVTARYWAEIPVRQIAVETGLTPVGIRKRLLRAYSRLADDLASELSGDLPDSEGLSS